jgi:hypothetical protein
VKRAVLILAVLASLAPAQDLLQPTTTEPGTKEENGIVTTLALTYVKIRNTVRDAYMSIQYSRAMIATLEEQKEWVRRNIRSWELVGNRVVKLVSEPGRWDNKLLEVESIFDKTDYLLWEETKNFDDLMYRQERYSQRIGGYVGGHIPEGVPLVSEFYKANAQLYRADPSWVTGMNGDSPEEADARRARDVARLQAAYKALQNSPEGKVRDATILAASRAQAQVAALRNVQAARAEKYHQMQAKLSEAKNVNALELSGALSQLKAAENDLDVLVLNKLEMEVVWAHLGTFIYDLTEKRAEELKASASFDEVANAMK